MGSRGIDPATGEPARARAKDSAGLLLFRRRGEALEVFLVRPGGPLYRGKDEGVWSVPKGEIAPGEDPREVARREFAEETGQSVEACGGEGDLVSLGSIRYKNGKVVSAWAFEGDWPAGAVLKSNTFTLEWPPRTGRIQEHPEVDRGEFFDLRAARRKIVPAQAPFLERLEAETRRKT